MSSSPPDNAAIRHVLAANIILIRIHFKNMLDPVCPDARPGTRSSASPVMNDV